MSTALSPPPLQTPVIEPPDRGGQSSSLLVTRSWSTWLRALVDRLQATAWIVKSVALSAQSASIGLTSLVPSASGVYRVSYRVRVTTPGTTSGLQVTITATDGAITVTQSSANYTGNDPAAPQSGVFLVRCDPATPLSYSTTYASTGPAMAYSMDLSTEAL